MGAWGTDGGEHRKGPNAGFPHPVCHTLSLDAVTCFSPVAFLRPTPQQPEVGIAIPVVDGKAETPGT